MDKQRDIFETWFARWRGVRTPAEEAAVLAFADAYDRAIESGNLQPEQLNEVVAAASSSRALLWKNAVDLLARLAVRWEAALDAVETMFASKQSQVRFAAICCLRADTPVIVANRLLLQGLTDKSSRVRWMAAQKASDFDRKELLPHLEAAFSIENNAKARRSIDFHLRLLRDGYIVENSTPAGYYFTVRIKDGIVSRYVTDEAMKTNGIDAIAAEMRRN